MVYPAGQASWERIQYQFTGEHNATDTRMAYTLSFKALWPTKFEKYVQYVVCS